MFRNKHVLITGVGRGIGKEIALQIARLGAHVSGFDLLEDELDDTRAALKQLSNNCYLSLVDITNTKACEQFVWEAEQRLGKVVGVINCAGITHIALAEETAFTTFSKLIDVNLLGTICITQICLPSVIESKGFVVGIGSIAGYSPLYYRTAYSASKHGVMGYFSSLRSEMKEKNIPVTVVCPGYVNTKLQENQEQFSNRTGESMSAAYVAQKMVEGIQQKKPILLIGKVAKQVYWLQKFFPKWYEKIMIRKTK